MLYNNITLYVDWVFGVKYGGRIYILTRADLVQSRGGTNSVY